MFENQTVYDLPAMLAMIRVTARKVQRGRYLLRKGFLVVLGGLALACGLLLASVFGQLDFSSRLICVGALVIGGISFLEGLCFHWFMARNTLKGLRRVGDSLERRYIFDEASFQSLQQGAESTYEYGTIKAAYETPATSLSSWRTATAPSWTRSASPPGARRTFGPSWRGSWAAPWSW